MSFAIVGDVISETVLNCYSNNVRLAQIPVLYVGLGGNSPIYDPIFREVATQAFHIDVESIAEPDHYPNVIKKMLKNVNVASKKWLCDKFDKSTRQESENHKFPSNASFISIEGTNKSLVATMDCNPNYMQADPYVGAQIAVAEACRNIICAGGHPLGTVGLFEFRQPNGSGNILAIRVHHQGAG
jgi:phosphoribosylformylglycinamidine synthase subunit PurL